jgi:hypothetical protein
MKRLFAFVVALGLTGNVFAACFGPICYDDQAAELKQRLQCPTSALHINTTETIDVEVSTPAFAGLLAVDSNYLLYISTSNTRGGWVKVGAQ